MVVEWFPLLSDLGSGKFSVLRPNLHAWSDPFLRLASTPICVLRTPPPSSGTVTTLFSIYKVKKTQSPILGAVAHKS